MGWILLQSSFMLEIYQASYTITRLFYFCPLSNRRKWSKVSGTSSVVNFQFSWKSRQEVNTRAFLMLNHSCS